MKELIIATKNLEKKRELEILLKDLGVKIISLDLYPDCPDVQEGTTCFRENAVLKAMQVSRFTGRPAIADDSGLEVDALGGAPGVLSARFAGDNVNYEQNNQKLLKMMEGRPKKDRGAQFKCVAALCAYPDVIGVVEGLIRGVITEKPKGNKGFGYDPVFFLPEYKQTFAQMDSALKNKISHRAKAMEKARELITAYFEEK